MLQWCCKSFKIRKYFHFEDGDLFHCYKLVPNQYHLDQWLILTNDRRIHSQNYFFYFETITDSIITAPWPMTEIMNERYVHPQNEIIFFYFETITNYSIISAPWPMTDIKKHERYLHPQNEIIFFLFRNYYSIIPVPWPMTDIMNDRYIHPQNENIFFYFETITASFQYLDQLLI